MKKVLVLSACLLTTKVAGATTSLMMNIDAFYVPNLVADYLSDEVTVLGVGPNAKVCTSEGVRSKIINKYSNDLNPVALAAGTEESKISLSNFRDERVVTMDYAEMLGTVLTLSIKDVNTAIIMRNNQNQEYRQDTYTVKIKIPGVPNCH